MSTSPTSTSATEHRVGAGNVRVGQGLRYAKGSLVHRVVAQRRPDNRLIFATACMAMVQDDDIVTTAPISCHNCNDPDGSKRKDTSRSQTYRRNR